MAHSTAFSAIVATTRNRDLDEVSKGHSLGALPLEHTGIRVRFGVLVGEAGKGVGDEASDGGNDRVGGERHLGFGAAEKVLRLRRGGRYV